MAKGNIVLLSFPFTDMSGSKLRPAIILAETVLDITACIITSQIGWQEAKDVLLSPNTTNGLTKTSLVRTNKIATLDRNLVQGLLGKLSHIDLTELNLKLEILFQLL